MGIHIPDPLFENAAEMGIWMNETYVHPTFLYESLWNLLGFVIANLIYRKKKFNGQVTLMYFAWYGFGRMFIEGLRADSLYVGPFRISQVIGALCFLVGTALLIVGFILQKQGMLEKWLKVDWHTKATAATASEDSAALGSVSGSSAAESDEDARDIREADENSDDTENKNL